MVSNKSAHDKIETVRTMGEAIGEAISVDFPTFSPPGIIVIEEEGVRWKNPNQNDKTEPVEIDEVEEWWNAWCEVRNILEEAFDADVGESGKRAVMSEVEHNDNMRISTDSMNLSISLYAGPDKHVVAEYLLDKESDQWEKLYIGEAGPYLTETTLGQAVSKAELTILANATGSTAEALDYWQTELAPHSYTQSRWADIRNVGRQTVNDRVQRAKDALDE